MSIDPSDAWLESAENGGIPDVVFCNVCGEDVDSGRCTCERCDECGDNIEGDPDASQVEVLHKLSGNKIKVILCHPCYEKILPGAFDSTSQSNAPTL